MKTVLLAVNLALMVPAAVEANDFLHLSVRLDDEQIIDGVLHLDRIGKPGHIEGSWNYPYLICSQEAGRTSAVSATAVSRAEVQITRRTDGNIEVAATATSVDGEKLIAAQTNCTASPLKAKSASEKAVFRPSSAPEKFILAGMSIAISGR